MLGRRPIGERCVFNFMYVHDSLAFSFSRRPLKFIFSVECWLIENQRCLLFICLFALFSFPSGSFWFQDWLWSNGVLWREASWAGE